MACAPAPCAGRPSVPHGRAFCPKAAGRCDIACEDGYEVHGYVECRGGRWVHDRVEKFDRRGTELIELLNIRIRAEILSEFKKFCQNSSEIQKFEDLSTFSKLFIEILRNSH